MKTRDRYIKITSFYIIEYNISKNIYRRHLNYLFEKSISAVTIILFLSLPTFKTSLKLPRIKHKIDATLSLLHNAKGGFWSKGIVLLSLVKIKINQPTKVELYTYLYCSIRYYINGLYHNFIFNLQYMRSSTGSSHILLKFFMLFYCC